MKKPNFDQTKVPIVMKIISNMSSLADSMFSDLGMDDGNDEIFTQKMNELESQLEEITGKRLEDCEPFLGYQAYTTLEMAAKRVLTPPEKSDLAELIEDRLSPYGFHFSNYECCRWTFSREVNGTQNVVIQGIPPEFYLELYSDSTGHTLRIREITNYDPAFNFDSISFNSETERRAALNKIADIVIKYGLEKFKEISVKKSGGG